MGFRMSLVRVRVRVMVCIGCLGQGEGQGKGQGWGEGWYGMRSLFLRMIFSTVLQGITDSTRVPH